MTSELTTSALQTRLQATAAICNQRLGERRWMSNLLDTVRDNQVKTSAQLKVDTMSRSVLELLSKVTEHEVRNYIEPLVTESLRLVFGYDMKFEMEFGVERNQVIVVFTLVDSAGNKITGDIEDAKGGGILDVISLVLRFVLLELFGLQGAVVLDEPGRFVDRKHQPAFGALILSFAEKFNRQILIVTHDDAICAIGTRHYHVHMDDQNISHITLVEEDK